MSMYTLAPHTFPTPQDLQKMLGFSVGFDGFFNRLSNVDIAQSGYPPYNIRKLNDLQYVVELALAGFSKSDIEVEVTEQDIEDYYYKIQDNPNYNLKAKPRKIVEFVKWNMNALDEDQKDSIKILVNEFRKKAKKDWNMEESYFPSLSNSSGMVIKLEAVSRRDDS